MRWHLQQYVLPANQGRRLPNAEELRRVADRFALSYPDLQIRFGLMSRQEVWSYIESAPFSAMAVQEAVKTEADERARRSCPK